MNIISDFQVAGLLLLLTLIFGWWLSRLGRPYHGLLFNAHKLFALGAVVLAGVRFSGTLKALDVGALIIGLFVLAALCVVALFASGALMSIGKLDYGLTLTTHRVGLVLLIFSLLLVVYWLGQL